jgi:hypothetical protein
LIRFPIIINFVLLVALIGPGSNRAFYFASKKAGVAASITLALQIWFVASSLFATTLFVWSLLRKSDVTEAKTLRPKRLDWILVLTWWATVVILCLYAFMMGMGG